MLVASEIVEVPLIPAAALILALSSFAVMGHQVVYTLTTSLMVVVAVETMAGEAVSEQTPDSQEVTVTATVC